MTYAEPSRDFIRRMRSRWAGAPRDWVSVPILKEDMGRLIELAALSVPPHVDVDDKKALVMYFADDEDRDQMVKACREALPNAVAHKTD